MHKSNPGSQGPLSISDAGPIGNFIVGSIGFVANSFLIVFFGVLILAAIGFGSAHVLVDWIGSSLGLTQAWLHLESIASETATTLSDKSSLALHNLIFGTIVGVVLAAFRYTRLRGNRPLRWALEAAASPRGKSALGFGLSCLLLHVSISMAIASLLALLGVVLPLPEFLGGTHSALIAAGNLLGGGGGFGGGTGGGPPIDIFMMLEYLIAVVVMIALVCGPALTVSYWGVGWLAWGKVYWLPVGV